MTERNAATSPSSAAMRRLFVAVPLPPEARTAVERLVDSLRVPEGRRIRWVRFDGLHLTLRFLGATEDRRLPDVVAAVDEAASGPPAFVVRLAGAGAFPTARRPRVLWLGVEDGSTQLAALASRVDSRLVARGWPADERPFRAHLTLARTDGVREAAAVAEALVAAAGGFSVEFAADRIVLFESLSGGRGPARYDPLHVTYLGPTR